MLTRKTQSLQALATGVGPPGSLTHSLDGGNSVTSWLLTDTPLSVAPLMRNDIHAGLHPRTACMPVVSEGNRWQPRMHVRAMAYLHVADDYEISAADEMQRVDSQPWNLLSECLNGPPCPPEKAAITWY